MASGSYKQPKYAVVSSAKVKPRSIDTETKDPKKLANAVTHTKTRKGYIASSDGVMKA